MEKELNHIFQQTLPAHYPAERGITRDAYIARFQTVLAEEIKTAPKIDIPGGNLATYIKLSILVLAMARVHEEIGLSEQEIGERTYRTAEAYFYLSPVKKWVQRMLFFSRLNIRQIQKRQQLSEKLDNGINGFKIRYVEGDSRDAFGVDYLQCGICSYFRQKQMFRYVKYCCLVDYAIMKHMGVSFTRTTTLGNGGERCDFRFAHEGKITEGWPPTWLPEFKAGQS